MADKILPQRVSAFHSSPQPTPHPLLLRPPSPLPATPCLFPSPLRSCASASQSLSLFVQKAN